MNDSVPSLQRHQNKWCSVVQVGNTTNNLLTGSGEGSKRNHFLVLTSAVARTTKDASKQK